MELTHPRSAAFEAARANPINYRVKRDELTSRKDKLLIFTAGLLASVRKARGLKLN
jgi:hypothetical protein